MNNAQILAGIASTEKEKRERREFLVSFIKEQLDNFNSLSPENIDIIPMEFLENASKSLAVLRLICTQIVRDDNSQKE